MSGAETVVTGHPFDPPDQPDQADQAEPADTAGRGGPVEPAGGDAGTAITDLYRGHALGLTRLALMMVGDRGTAEDVVQDAFTGLYKR
ncbi:MAG: RNA polymerase sigma factor, partial [Spirillospora sp.]